MYRFCYNDNRELYPDVLKRLKVLNSSVAITLAFDELETSLYNQSLNGLRLASILLTIFGQRLPPVMALCTFRLVTIRSRTDPDRPSFQYACRVSSLPWSMSKQ